MQIFKLTRFFSFYLLIFYCLDKIYEMELYIIRLLYKYEIKLISSIKMTGNYESFFL